MKNAMRWGLSLAMAAVWSTAYAGEVYETLYDSDDAATAEAAPIESAPEAESAGATSAAGYASGEPMDATDSASKDGAANAASKTSGPRAVDDEPSVTDLPPLLP